MNATLLVADDDPSVRESLSRVLRSEGYNVVSVASGRQALDYICNNTVQLVLLDINMPDLNGWDAFDQIREINPFLPVVIITARPSQQQTAASAGADALMEKPLMLPSLLELIGKLLGEAPESRRQRLAGKSVVSKAVKPLTGAA